MKKLDVKRLKIVAASGYFDPIHVGHLEYLEKAKSLGDRLFVIVNNDIQAQLKKGKPFMKEEDRLRIVQALKCVDVAVMSLDIDTTVRETLAMIKPDVFANGGDRKEEEIPEAEICRKLEIDMVDGLGEKIRSSSELIKEAENNE